MFSITTSGAKSGEDEVIVKRDVLQFDVHGLELDQQPVSQELVQRTQEALAVQEEVTQGALSEREQKILGVLSDSEEDRRRRHRIPR